uniref:Uncharacterized protein n=1 Tax=Parascaris equorum TaxID=6256 RepID=A0A914REQ5_PAREQ
MRFYFASRIFLFIDTLSNHLSVSHVKGSHASYNVTILQRDAPTFKARVGCNQCEDCRMPDCQICLRNKYVQNTIQCLEFLY